MWVELGTICVLALVMLHHSLAFVARPSRATRLSAIFASIPFARPTEKVSEIMKWLDDEDIKFTVKKGVLTENFTGVDIHLRDSLFMSIITEDSVINKDFAETGIFAEEKFFLIPFKNLGYEDDTMRHRDMEDLGEHIKKVRAAADRGELIDTTGPLGGNVLDADDARGRKIHS